MKTPLSPRRNGGLATLAGCLILLQFVGRCSAMWQDTHFQKKMDAAMAAEATDLRRASNLLRSALKPDMVDLENSMDSQLRAIYEDRGSKYYPDGTAIPGNEDVGSRPHDPRVPTGFGNPLWSKLHGTENMEISTSPHEAAALEASTADWQSVESGWTYVLGWGDTQHQAGEQESNMQTLLTAAPNNIVRRTCMLCEGTHAEIYVRFASVPTNVMETLKNTWTNTMGTMGTDFNLYSTYEDAVNEVNAWTYCDAATAEAPTMGFPGNCGPTGSVADQWNSYSPRVGQLDVAFFVEDANSPAEYRDLNEVEVIREGWLWSDRDKYLAELGCYGLDKLDQRRECYRACHYMREIFDEGTALLCRSLMERGSEEGSKTLMKFREYVGDGLEKGGKIKSTHMLGNEGGLPNMGTY